MKKFLLLLTCLPLIGFGQSCNYGGTTDASKLCNFYRGNNFTTYKNADIALDKILGVTGMSKRFVLKECNDISNCIATTYDGIRYILYDRYFMDKIATQTNSWSNLSILAHEVGHHVNGHVLGSDAPTLSESRQMELEADEYSGFVMYKLGANLSQAKEAIRLISTNNDDSYSTHPSRDKRLRAIEKGYNKAKGNTSDNINSTNSSTLTAEDYFYKAFNTPSSDYQQKIDNYTKCLRIDPDYGPWAYNNRGNSYKALGNYKDAIADYTRAVRMDPDYAVSYNGRGATYAALGNYKDAIADYTRAIRKNPDYGKAYNNRGISKQKLGLPYCSDYKRGCELGEEVGCEWFNKNCSKGYNPNKNRPEGDYSHEREYDPKSRERYNYDPKSRD